MTALLRKAGSITFPVALAVFLSVLLFSITGYDVLEVVLGVLEGAIIGPGSFWQTLRWAAPLLLLACGFLFCFRAGEFNIGGQGQMVIGGLSAVSIALLLPGPPVAVIPICMIAGILGGAIWSGLAGWLKIRFGSDEVIVTLMLNFIAVLFVQWVTTGVLKDPAVRGESASTPTIDPGLRLSSGEGMSWLLLALVILFSVVAWIIANRTRFGLQLRYAGQAPLAALWQGMRVGQLKITAFLLAGGFAGLAGALEVLGPNGRVATGATPTLGFTAIVVTIVGGASVPGIALAALLFGGLQAAVLFLPIVSDLPTSGLQILEGMVAALVTARFWLSRRKAG